MKKGEIYYGSKRGWDAAWHPIVYLKSNDKDSFVGGVLTHSKDQGNILMKKEHFEEKDSSGRKYKLGFNNTYLVIGRFIKTKEWGPYNKIGQLSEKGVAFVEKATKKFSPKFWDDYVNQL